MLILGRRHGESVIFFDSDGRQTRTTIELTKGGRVRLCIDGPARVLRAEVQERLQACDRPVTDGGDELN